MYSPVSRNINRRPSRRNIRNPIGSPHRKFVLAFKPSVVGGMTIMQCPIRPHISHQRNPSISNLLNLSISSPILPNTSSPCSRNINNPHSRSISNRNISRLETVPCRNPMCPMP